MRELDFYDENKQLERALRHFKDSWDKLPKNSLRKIKMIVELEMLADKYSQEKASSSKQKAIPPKRIQPTQCK